VLVLSPDFIARAHLLKELQLLLERRDQFNQQPDAQQMLLPVYHNITPQQVLEVASQYKQGDGVRQQWGRSLEVVSALSGIRLDEVRTGCEALCSSKASASLAPCTPPTAHQHLSVLPRDTSKPWSKAATSCSYGFGLGCSSVSLM
jgi:hypothetical protein